MQMKNISKERKNLIENADEQRQKDVHCSSKCSMEPFAEGILMKMFVATKNPNYLL